MADTLVLAKLHHAVPDRQVAKWTDDDVARHGGILTLRRTAGRVRRKVALRRLAEAGETGEATEIPGPALTLALPSWLLPIHPHAADRVFLHGSPRWEPLITIRNSNHHLPKKALNA